MRIVFILTLLLALPANLFSREFLNTYMHINFLYMYGLSTWGDITDYEHKSYAIIDKENNNKNVRADQKDSAYGFMIDVTPIPSFVLGNAEHAVKFGLRFAYRFHTVQQDFSLENKDYSADLMKFQTFMYGLVIYYAPTIEPTITSKHYNASKGLSFFALMGKVRGGEITAFPVWKKKKTETETSPYPYKPDYDNSTSFSGYKFDIGIGGEVSICSSVNLGLNFFYSHIKYKMKRKVYEDYTDNDGIIHQGFGRRSSLKEICLEIFMGIPIQYF